MSDGLRAAVERIIEEATQRAYFKIALDRSLTIEPQGLSMDRAIVPPHWREEAEDAARIYVEDLRDALAAHPEPNPGQPDTDLGAAIVTVVDSGWLPPLLLAARAEAWDEGHRGLCRRHGVVPFEACRNPYRDGGKR